MFNEKINKILEDFAKEENCNNEDITFYIFPQTWGSTSLGYGGWGGQAITQSHTIIFYNEHNNNALISYGGEFIRVDNPNREFFDDIYKFRIEPKNGLGKYKREY